MEGAAESFRRFETKLEKKNSFEDVQGCPPFLRCDEKPTVCYGANTEYPYYLLSVFAVTLPGRRLPYPELSGRCDDARIEVQNGQRQHNSRITVSSAIVSFERSFG